MLSETSGIVDALADALARRLRTLETHPNAPAYAALRARNAGDVKPAAESAESSNLRFSDDAFILETDPSPAAFGAGGTPCTRVSSSNDSFATHRLETLRSDVWHTHCAIAARLRAPTSIRAVTLSARAAHSGSRAARVRRSRLRASDGQRGRRRAQGGAAARVRVGNALLGA